MPTYCFTNKSNGAVVGSVLIFYYSAFNLSSVLSLASFLFTAAVSSGITLDKIAVSLLDKSISSSNSSSLMALEKRLRIPSRTAPLFYLKIFTPTGVRLIDLIPLRVVTLFLSTFPLPFHGLTFSCLYVIFVLTHDLE